MGNVVLVSIPTYGGKMEADLIFPLMRAAKDPANKYDVQTSNSSANCMGFNKLWVNALDLRDAGKVTHFCMHHTDIVPEYYWLDKMLGIMKETGADVLSAVSPIKDHHGYTSTALDEQVGDVDPHWRVRRLTMHEVFQRPLTWTEPKLLLNDGLMVVDLSKPWVEKIHFRFEDAIIRHKGKRMAVCFPEDWAFSRDARSLGASLWATRAVSLRHMGGQAFPNSQIWGTEKTDAVKVLQGIPEAVVETMDSIPGWFLPEEAALLYRTVPKALAIAPSIVEVGSWKGRSTSVLAAACQQSGSGHVYAVDPHEGNLGEHGSTEPTAEQFQANIKRAGVSDMVTLLRQRSTEVNWPEKQKIGLLFIDGLHHYEGVAADLGHFCQYLPEGAYVAFHDHEAAYPGVIKLVGEEIERGNLEAVEKAGALQVCRVARTYGPLMHVPV